jgi:hypothetical protein
MKNLTLFLTIATILFSCKKEDKKKPEADNTEAIKIVQDTLVTSTNHDILGSWLPQNMETEDFDKLEIDKTSLHLYYSQGEIALKYSVVANEMILTYDWADTKLTRDGDDCNGKKVGKFYKDNLGNLILDIKTNGLNCFGINNGKFIFQRGVSAAIDDIEKSPDTNVDFDIFSVIIPGFESEIDETAKNSPKNTISLNDKSDGWGLSSKKVQILSADKSLKFEIEYCFLQTLAIQSEPLNWDQNKDWSTARIVYKGNSGFQKVKQLDYTNFILNEFSNGEYIAKCEKELQQKLKLRDTLVESEYVNAKLSYQGKPVLFEPKFILLKITATNPSGVKTIRFLKVEVYEGGD